MDPHVSQESESLPGFVFCSSLEAVELTSGCDVVCDVSSDEWSVFERCCVSFWLNSVVLESSSFICSCSFDFSVSSKKICKCIAKTNRQNGIQKHIKKSVLKPSGLFVASFSKRGSFDLSPLARNSSRALLSCAISISLSSVASVGDATTETKTNTSARYSKIRTFTVYV